METIKQDLDLRDIEHFIGTTQYHLINFFGIEFKLTDGVKYLMENG